MSTLYDLITSANYNIQENGTIGMMIGKEQLKQVVKEIESGKELYDELEEVE